MARVVRSPSRAFRLCFGIAAAALVSMTAFAVEVDKSELQSSTEANVVFLSYEGPHSVINTREQIRGIGVDLGKSVAAGNIKAGFQNRYFVIHAVDDTQTGALDADIFGLGVDAGVDHIRNLRLIIQGYLQAAYNYSASDAALLANFVTVYNAVYRGNWDYLVGRYKPLVTDNLSAEKAGLSLRWDEWPGRSLIIVPLNTNPAAGPLSAVDTTSLTEKTVTDQMRSEEDKSLQQRKDMVDLKEREASDAAQSASLEREAIVTEEARIAAEKAAVEQEKAAIAVEEAKVKAAEPTPQGQSTTAPVKEEAQATPTEATQPSTEPTNTEAAPKTEEAAKLDERKDAVAQKEAEIAKDEQALQDRKDAAAEKETFAEQKQAEATDERAQIEADQQQMIQEEKPQETPPSGTLVAVMRDETSPYARLVLANLEGGAYLKKSLVDSVRPRTVVETADAIYAVAGVAQGSGAVRIISIDPTTLEMKAQGDQEIAEDSPLYLVGEDLYALAKVDGATRLARFGKDLALKALSPMAIHPYAAPRFLEAEVAVQAADGSVVLLDLQGLAQKGAIK